MTQEELPWVAIDFPGLGLEPEDVFLCDACDGDGVDCPTCRGYRLLHGYNENGIGYPVVQAERFDPERDRPAFHAAPVAFGR